ncbi:DapH/DapD/GlmU-related protein [Phenylobacterium sp.]|uniref:acyltransferase n=1 Tax=Phenylobacterium sp. TaxID=1871053 RepID=UPI0025E9CDA7|nr:acyltransferase [Phenylobacterium sp.]
MALKSLNQLRAFRNALIGARNWWLQKRFGLVLEGEASISLSSRFRSSARGDIVVGHQTLIAFKTLFLTRDARTGERRPIRVGSRCFIGGGSVILPGVTIGDHCIVGGGSVVFEDVPSGSIVIGNPAKVLRSGVELLPFGRLPVARENTRKLYKL